VGPDIIVLDLNLPGLDGYGVLSHLRSRPATANIPVIVLTAKGDEDNEVRVFELGADDFLTKAISRARSLRASRSRARPPPLNLRSGVLRGHVRSAGRGAKSRGAGTAARCPRPQSGIWETVHGTIEPGETPVQASLRELREETGLVPREILQSQPYRSVLSAQERRAGAFIPVFAAFVAPGASVKTLGEHDRAEWLNARDAAGRFAWPRERRSNGRHFCQ